MRKLFTLLLLTTSLSALAKAEVSDLEIKQQMIRESIQSYPGRCPCPYNLASNGSRCGKRSAYTKPGGYAPLCFETDITEQMLDNYKKKNGQ